MRLITDNVVAEPGLPFALDAAARLNARLPAGVVHDALSAGEPDLRARACRCARFWPATVPRLIELLEDLHREVSREAAIALGVMGRSEAIPFLVRLVKQEPTPEIMEALVSIGNDECFVLGWTAQRHRMCQYKVEQPT
ncbi:MAG: HEAT repeat domain-containing protein [Acidiphilium sp.]|nr:HEAT repeat domain-containing protein [Acidiphilium sp.]MDD4936916.1 HEAT repeat domain-containing protein [Acidiphilium sp.]